MDLLKSLPVDERLDCGQRVVHYIKVLLNDPVVISVKVRRSVNKKKHKLVFKLLYTLMLNVISFYLINC